jgi:hypothetical protein
VSQDQRHRIGLDPERRENVAQWSSHDSRKAVWRSRNRGRKAIGFYEGSSAVEGTSGRHEPSAFTSRWSRRPWRLLHVGNDRETLHRARATDGRAKALPYFRGRGRRDRGVRGLVDSRRRGKKTPTLLSPYAGHGARSGNRQKQAARVSLRSAEAFSSAVKALGPPVKHRSPRLLCLPRGESRGANRERTKYGCT